MPSNRRQEGRGIAPRGLTRGDLAGGFGAEGIGRDGSRTQGVCGSRVQQQPRQRVGEGQQRRRVEVEGKEFLAALVEDTASGQGPPGQSRGV